MRGMRTDQQTNDPARFTSQLQTPEVMRVELTASPQHGGNTRATSNLIQRPDLVGLPRGPDDDQARRIDGQVCGSGGIKAVLSIDYHQYHAIVSSSSVTVFYRVSRIPYLVSRMVSLDATADRRTSHTQCQHRGATTAPLP